MSTSFVAHPVAKAAPVWRAAFIRSIFTQLAVALLAFLLVEELIVQLGVLDSLNDSILGDLFGKVGKGRIRPRVGRASIGLLAMLVVLMAVPAWIADSWGKSAVSKPLHYAGFALYLVVNAIASAPVLFFLVRKDTPQILLSMAAMTVFLMLGALAVVLFSDKDYSLVTIIFCLSGSVMVGMLATAVVLGATVGVLFFSLMQFYAVGALVIRTSQLMDETEPQNYAGAGLSLFASMPLLLPMFFVYSIRMMPGTKDAAMVQAEFSKESRHVQCEFEEDSVKEAARQRRERERVEYVERQMARGRKA